MKLASVDRPVNKPIKNQADASWLPDQQLYWP